MLHPPNPATPSAAASLLFCRWAGGGTPAKYFKQNPAAGASSHAVIYPKLKPHPQGRVQRIAIFATRIRIATPSAAMQSSSTRHRLEAVNHDHETIPERLAVVTGGNRGIGLEVCRQLALQGVTVILTARDEKRGKDAVESLCHESNLSNIIFHQLDILDGNSRASLARYINSRFGKLDILLSGKAVNLIQSVIVQTYDEAVKCLNTNYYGLKWITEALLPLLKQSPSGARIVNTTSLRSELKRMPNEKLRDELRNIDIWDEARIEAMLNEFLLDLKNERLEEAGWPTMLPAYSMSKTVVNLYTRILAKRHPEMRINCVHPGFVNTEINWNTGIIPPEEGARGAVKAALLPQDGPTGCYFDQTELGEAW
uniref:Uncharacterized protein n=2 Tax=Oryza TaxID=4527 RepID=A0A0E0QCX5_ORYRU